MPENVKLQEETLDPQDWQELRDLGHQMVDDMMDMLQHIREKPVWQPIPQEVKDFFKKEAPQQPEGATQAYHDFKEQIMPRPLGNIHPRFWGWVIGTGTPMGMLADMLCAGMNFNVGGGEQISNQVELQVIDWCKEMLGFPAEASGLLTSGGSMANITGLTVARNTKANYNVRQEGLTDKPRMMVYASEQVHNSVDKGVELLGLGNQSLRKIPVNADYEIEIDALKAAIQEDKAAGRFPFCIVGNAGTVNTGAIDDLNALADIAQAEDLWFHIDGAFGSLAAVSPELRPMVRGLDRADSLAFDLHKWMYMPIEVGCTLVRFPEAHRNTFNTPASYLAYMERGMASGAWWPSEYGVQLSRNFRALKVWMSLKEHGIEKYGRVIKQNVDQVQYLVKLVEEHPQLELMASAPLNVACFRFVADGLNDEQLSEINKEILMQLHESGVAGPSYATLDGKFMIRVANTNHRTRSEDFDVLVEEVVRLGNALKN